METLFIPTEADFRKWIKEAIKECLENLPVQSERNTEGVEPLLNRKEIAGMFRISLVTLHEWMNGGLPSHKQGGRVYFLRSEVLEYVRQKKGRTSITLKHHQGLSDSLPEL